MSDKNLTIAPDYAVHPGEILEEDLEALGITKQELALRTGLTPKTISEIVNGKASVTPDVAVALEKSLGTSAELWTNLDSQYRLHQARKKNLEISPELVSWSEGFPVAELKKRGVLSQSRDKQETASELLSFFAVSNITAWKKIYEKPLALFRKSPSFEVSTAAMAAWIRIAERGAQQVRTKPYNARRFERVLRQIRGLTREEPTIFEPKVRELCAQTGVAFVLVPELPKCRTSGATRWIGRSKIMMALSLRYKTDDQFWFSFFHEAGHIVLHGKGRVFVDLEGSDGDKFETEADQFARDTLLAAKLYEEFKLGGRFFYEDIAKFAERIGIAPGIVVGALQHDECIKYSWHNGLKRKLELVANTEASARKS